MESLGCVEIKRRRWRALQRKNDILGRGGGPRVGVEERGWVGRARQCVRRNEGLECVAAGGLLTR